MPDTKSDVYQDSVALHKKFQGKLGVVSLVPVKTRADLSLAYTPGVAEACRVIAADPKASYDLTWRGRTIAVISDGSAVLGLGNIGPAAALPVMEGKSLLMKEFGGVDSVPLVIDTQDTAKIVEFVKQVAPSFAGINLEDIAAPRCFDVEDQLQEIGIPVFHDDQHGTAIVVTAALQNAAKVVGKNFSDLNVVMVGAGAAGLATAQMLLGVTYHQGHFLPVPGAQGVKDVILTDRKGALVEGRADQDGLKAAIASVSNRAHKSGSLADVLHGADVIIGVSGPGLITGEMIKTMAPGAIVFAMANPTPEIMPDEAHAAGAAVVATGRSDFANQVNNVLAFPGVFQAVVRGRLPKITTQMKYAASAALARMVETPNAEHILPDPFTPNLATKVADAILSISAEK